MISPNVRAYLRARIAGHLALSNVPRYDRLTSTTSRWSKPRILAPVTSLVTALIVLPVRSSNFAIGKIGRILPLLRGDGADDRLFELAPARLGLFLFSRSIFLELLVS